MSFASEYVKDGTFKSLGEKNDAAVEQLNAWTYLFYLKLCRLFELYLSL